MMLKYRHKVFEEPCGSVLKNIIHKISYDYDIDIVELEVPLDHIHRVVRSVIKSSSLLLKCNYICYLNWQFYYLCPR